MSRRRIIEEPVNHERWLISYADFITLLFAFFVVMYSISQVNEGKYKVLSETLTNVFSSKDSVPVERSLKPIQIGEMAKSNPLNLIDLQAQADRLVGAQSPGEESGTNSGESNNTLPAEFLRINEQLDQAFSSLLGQGLVTVRGNEEWLEVELKSSLLFSSGDARLSNPALELLGDIVDILKQYNSPVRVEGFTDNIPIKTVQYPSNWQLSSARAAAVVQLFIEEGMAPERLAAIGYGEFQPVADNTTEQGRTANRRVVLMISKTGELRPTLKQISSVAELLGETAEALPVVDQTDAPVNTAISADTVSPDVPVTDASVRVEDQLTEPNSLEGVKTIKLNDGGLLFTNDNPAVENQ
ncbi:MAG: flagellar motor protein MotD [Spongiibacteraceae bacterium]